MNKIMSSILVAVASLWLVACSPGEKAGGTTPAGAPRPTVGSVFGNAPPGTIVGVVCTTTTADDKKGLTCPPPVSILVGADGKYKVDVHQAVGSYQTYFSLGGHRSEMGSPGCGFSLSIDGNSGGLFDCHQDDVNLTPLVFTPPSLPGLSVSDFIPSLIYTLSDPGSGGALVATVISTGNIDVRGFSWKTSLARRIELYYNQTKDIVRLTSDLNSSIGALEPAYHFEISCGGTSDVNLGGEWYYECSRFGITFDKTRGVITFESTPTYWKAPYIPSFDNPHVIGMEGFKGWAVSGSLTFPPF